jgi:hypothetical protein
MRTVRTNCFETNSSSTHSFTIDTSYRSNKDMMLSVVHPGEFGWEWRSFNDAQTKASYLWTMALSYDTYDSAWSKPFKSLKKNLLALGKKHLVDFVKPASNSYCYVDHASDHLPKLYEKFPETKKAEGLWNFINDSSYWIMLGNDNEYGPPNSRLTPNQIANATKFLYLDVDPQNKYVIDGLDEDTIQRAAERAFFAYNERMEGRFRGDQPWPKIVKNDGSVLTVNFEKYDHKTEKYETVKSETYAYSRL